MSCCEMTPSRSSPAFLLLRFRNLAFSRLPSSLQSALQYFSLTQPRNFRLQTRHAFRTLWSVVSSACSLPIYCLVAPLFCPMYWYKIQVHRRRKNGTAERLSLPPFPHHLFIVRAKAKPAWSKR